MTTRKFFIPPQHQKQRGAALVVGLLLLVVLTLLAISGMNTSTVQLQMAGSEKDADNALDAAVIGVGGAIREGVYSTTGAALVPTAAAPNSTGVTDQAAMSGNVNNGTTGVPAAGYSM